MPNLHLRFQDDRTAFSPGEKIVGTASWDTAQPPAKAAVSLIWSTRGKGTQDIEIVQTFDFSGPQARDSRPFQVTLPDAPYSFSGQLISLVWMIELNIDPGDECEAVEIVVAPGSREVLLPRLQA